MFLPNSNSAGETPKSGGGELQCKRSALATVSVSSDPLGLIFVVSIRFIHFTALSAQPLLCGKYAEEIRWLIPIDVEMFEIRENCMAGHRH